jgi:ribosomal RNA assembly protein
MKKIFIEKASRVSKARSLLEEKLKIKITVKGKEVTIDGTPELEYFSEKVIDAINSGFEIEDALLLIDEDYMIEILNIKEFTKRTDLERIRGRIIGTQRRTLNTLEQLTGCLFQLKENEVIILGPVDRIQQAQESVISLIQGSKQSNVYAHLEKNRPIPLIDLGLKKDE